MSKDSVTMPARVPGGTTPQTSAEEKANRTLLKVVRLAHAMSDEERELALVLMQAITAWNGFSEAA